VNWPAASSAFPPTLFLCAAVFYKLLARGRRRILLLPIGVLAMGRPECTFCAAMTESTMSRVFDVLFFVRYAVYE
jgi:hypothetical protein